MGRAATVRPELRNHTLDAMMAQHESVATFKKKVEEAKGKTNTVKDVQAARRDLEDAGRSGGPLDVYLEGLEVRPLLSNVAERVSSSFDVCGLQSSWRLSTSWATPMW